jgi:tRNA pseudouridine38-40 synthase
MPKLACHVEYFSSPEAHYAGFQRQDNVKSIQEELETALSQIADENILIFAAGRTDAGVHAMGQIIHFETQAERALDSWLRGANTYLPKDIRIKSAHIVPNDFHARYSALSRTYEYWIDNNLIGSSLFKNHILHHPYYLDISKMNQASLCLIGEHDFSAFRASECQSKSPFRFVNFIKISRPESLNSLFFLNNLNQNLIKIEINANAFVHHMVRNIVGSLLEIGDGRKEIGWLEWVLNQKDRKLAGMTAPAHGLYLKEIKYPEKFKTLFNPI